MGPTERLIKEVARQGHPLGRSITVEEVPVLIEALRQRLGVSSKELDLSPSSLKLLEQRLIDLHQSMQKRGEPFSDEELVCLVRQIAAYIGEVLVRHTGGEWAKAQTLWGTEVVFKGPWVVIKGHKFVSSYPTHFIIGSEAASAWDEIAEGRKPNLYRTYREARAKRIKEHL
jgi:hypothetical protein